eukprot:TRINITY_DN841_c0_g5_i1.p1 TRINITY_DN841_c0_g5~~TRINITY_DN841_c0_g5_i1.p1  ORF type:complete len:726 (+),score=249.28 TRINITY_DN841_c0_g5_i1:38-2179(+)
MLREIGRDRKLQLVTCFAVDRNEKFSRISKGDLADRVNVVALDVHKDLVQQLRDMEPKPDVVVSKLHKALGSSDERSKQCIENYESLQNSEYGGMLERMNMIPLACEMKLVDRYSMVDLLKRVVRVVRKISGNKCDVGVPEWVCCDKEHMDIKPPPFPVVVKAKSTAVKQMGVVFNKDGLDRFMEKSQSEQFTLEQYIPHSGIVFKIYVIGKHTYVAGRPSLPDLCACPRSLQAISKEIQGEFTTYPTSDACNGYLTFYSNLITNREGKVSCLSLYDHTMSELSDLEYLTVKLMQEAIQSEWGIDLFGFDVLVDKNTKKHYVVDVNVLPGYKGVDKFRYHTNKLFLEYGERYALATDVAYLRSADVLAEYCKRHLPEWDHVRSPLVENLRDANIMKITPEGDPSKAVLATFFDTQHPTRRIHDEKNFLLNITSALSAAGFTPPLLHTATAPYYGCKRYLAHFSECPPGSRPFCELLRESLNTPAVLDAFAALGKELRRYHNFINNEKFYNSIVDHHFGLFEGLPLCFPLLENWRRKVLLKAEKLRWLSEQWGDLCNAVFENSDVEEVKKVVLGRLRSKYSTQVVFGYFDVSLDSILLHSTEGLQGVSLLSTSFCGPNMAVHDFANLYTCLLTATNEETADTLLQTTAAAYLESEAAHLADFVSDCKAFIPIASLINVYKYVLYASRSVPEPATSPELESALLEYKLFKQYYAK